MRSIIKILLIGALCATSSTAFAQITSVVYPSPQSASDSRFNDLIELLDSALKVTADEFGPYVLKPSDEIMGEGRYLDEVKKGGQINVVYSSTSEQKESELLPIRVPLRRGLLGYRIFLINKDKQYLFSRIREVYELKLLALGQGHDWGDLKVYTPQNFRLETASKYESLFKMLVKDRFDYFPRGVNEAWVEYDERASSLPNLAVERDLMLFYPWPYYFFVSKDNPQLALRIEKGLNKMIDNGMFDDIFFRYHGETIRRANMSERRLFRITNPILPAQTPSLDDRRLWYAPPRTKQAS